jgi:hypothetical protein
VKNDKYYDKFVIANDVQEATEKYYDYLQTHLNADVSPVEILRGVTNISLVDTFNEEDTIL